MPWQCKSCESEVPDDQLRCPSCEVLKTSWTMVHDQTRTFRVSGRKVHYLSGDGRESLPADELDVDEELVPAERVCVLSKADAQAIAERGHLPGSRHVLTARLFPHTHRDWTVTIVVLYESDEVDDLEFPAAEEAELNEEEYLDRRFVFVYGEEPELGEELFAGIELVDLSEEGGFAPAIEISALKKPPAKLPVSGPVAEGVLRIDGEPATELDLVLVLAGGEERAARTDGEGRWRVEGVPAGEYTLRLAWEESPREP